MFYSQIWFSLQESTDVDEEEDDDDKVGLLEKGHIRMNVLSTWSSYGLSPTPFFF